MSPLAPGRLTPISLAVAEDGVVVALPACAARHGGQGGTDGSKAGEGGPITLVLVLDQALVDAITRSPSHPRRTLVLTTARLDRSKPTPKEAQRND